MSHPADRIADTTPEASEQEASGTAETAVVTVAADQDDPVTAKNAAPTEGSDDTARLVAERDEYLDTLQRLQADFENFRKRSLRERADEAVRARGDVVARLLPVLDAFDAALIHHRAAVEPLHGALRGALESLGVERLDPVGEPFDPSSHEAVVHQPGDDGDAAKPVVVEVVRPGYRLAGRLLRPAAVAVRG